MTKKYTWPKQHLVWIWECGCDLVQGGDAFIAQHRVFPNEHILFKKVKKDYPSIFAVYKQATGEELDINRVAQRFHKNYYTNKKDLAPGQRQGRGPEHPFNDPKKQVLIKGQAAPAQDDFFAKKPKPEKKRNTVCLKWSDYSHIISEYQETYPGGWPQLQKDIGRSSSYFSTCVAENQISKTSYLAIRYCVNEKWKPEPKITLNRQELTYMVVEYAKSGGHPALLSKLALMLGEVE
jgi:hypothetical protein